MFDAIKLFRALDKMKKRRSHHNRLGKFKTPDIADQDRTGRRSIYKMIKFYACREFLSHIQAHAFIDFDAFKKHLLPGYPVANG